MVYLNKNTLAFGISLLCFHLVSTQSFNPTILQDSRDLPKTDGTFGFLYRTEDGIAHAAKGDSDGVIHGRFSYTDPTGLKVNYNYNAGSRVTPGYNYDDTPRPAPKRPQHAPPQRYRESPEEYSEPSEPRYVEPQPKYVPQTRPPTRSNRRPQQYSAQYREPVANYQPRRTRPTYPVQNEVYDEYN